MMRSITTVIVMVYLGVAWPGKAETAAYPGPAWQPVASRPFATPPVLREGEAVDNYAQGIVCTKGGFVHWVVNDARGTYLLLRWNMYSGETARILEKDTRIRALAYSAEEDALVLRTSRTVEYYDNTTLKPLRNLPFEKLDHYWRDMAIVKDHIITIEADASTLGIFATATGKKQKTITCGKEKIQRLFKAGDNRLWLWSSYWWARFYLLDIDTSLILDESWSSAPHRLFFMAKEAEDNTLAVFDLSKKIFAHFTQEGKMWVEISGGCEILGDKLGFRFAPRTDTVSASFSIKPLKTLPAREAVFAIPLNTYGQKLEQEAFPAGGELITDSLGNRYLRLALPEIKEGGTYHRVFYQARLTRYHVYFNLEKFASEVSVRVPEHLQMYLQNEDIYGLDDPLVKSTYTGRFAALSPLAKRIEAIYGFALDEVENVWDGRADKVPGILKNMHGGCTEHSYVQVAMLRSGGLPARFNWNALPDHNTTVLEFNHKYAEVWFPATGWLPLEPLAAGLMAGRASSYHFIFAVRSGLKNDYFDSYDRLAAYLGKNRGNTWAQAPIQVQWERSAAASL